MTDRRDDLRDIILETFESSLEAQLRAVKRLRHVEFEKTTQQDKGKSHVDMAFDILKKARRPLHVSELIVKINESFGVEIDRESLVSALTKKVLKNDRFTRTDKNTFTVR